MNSDILRSIIDFKDQDPTFIRGLYNLVKSNEVYSSLIYFLDNIPEDTIWDDILPNIKYEDFSLVLDHVAYDIDQWMEFLNKASLDYRDDLANLIREHSGIKE